MTLPQPADDDLLARALALRGEGGRLHLTLSFLVEETRMQALVVDGEGRCFWNRKLLSALRGDDGGDDYQDSRRLGRAIEPLFNDIADRQRGLFIQDFLLDTPSAPQRPGDSDGENVCDEPEISFPADIRWETEGDRFALSLAQPVRLRARCRAFWVAHSNAALTYHLSLELPYAHDHAHYYALSLLQKAVAPTEGTQWLDGDGSLRVHSREAGGALPLAGYLEAMFERHAASLLAGIRVELGRRGIAMAPPVPGRSLWQQLLGEREGERPALRTPAGLRCRGVVLLQDPYFFALLRPQLRLQLRDVQAVRPARDEAGRSRYDEQLLRAPGIPPHHLDYYFLSGFLQNIVDFLRQDVSEIQDGTDPIYPPAGVEDDDSHFLVYATQSAVYEVVAGSRSLDVGRGWIGTCPYLFLVHLMTLHNETLVHRYEAMVRGLVEQLERDGLLHAETVKDGGAWSTRVADEAFEAFRRFRLDTFNHVARHRYFNVLRYDTEREFYESIETVRGIQQREAYWAGVVSDLERTVDDLRGNEAQKSEKFLERVLFYVAFLGLLQVVFQLIDFGFDGAWEKLRWSLAAFGATVVAMLVLLHSRGLVSTRRWRQALDVRRRRRPEDLSG